MLVSVVTHVRYGGKVLAYQLAQDARACSMQDSHARHAYEYGVVDEVGDGVDGLVATHATYVQVLAEVLSAVVDDVACVVGDTAVGTHDIGIALFGLALLSFWRFSVLQPFGAHLGFHTSEDDSCHLALNAFNGADALQALDTDGVTHFELRVES